eukprot:4807647-Pyramimonas_sp.AAC.1
MTSALASLPRPRCKAAACRGGVALLLATLSHACTSRTKSRKGALPVKSQNGPRVRVASNPSPRMLATAKPRRAQTVPKIAALT